MDLTASIRSLFESTDTTVRECRRCGTTLAADDEHCPVCGAEDTAEYEI